MFKKISQPPVLLKPTPTVQALHGGLDENMSDDERRHADNMQNIAQASLDMQYDAQQKNLIIMHRTMLIAFASVGVAVAVGVAAVLLKPSVTVKIYEQKSTPSAVKR